MYNMPTTAIICVGLIAVLHKKTDHVMLHFYQFCHAETLLSGVKHCKRTRERLSK